MARRSRLATLILLVLTATILTVPPASAAPTWLAPVTLSAQGEPAHSQQVAVDAAGNVTAVWARGDGSHFRIQSSTRPAGGEWSPPVTISLAGQDSSEPQVAVDAAGNATAVWTRTDGSVDQVRTSSRPFGGAWSSPITLSASSQDDLGDPHVAVDGAGNVTAIWQRLIGGFRRVHASTRPPGGSWSGVDLLSETGGTARDLSLSANPGTSGATATWTRFNGANYVVQVSSRVTTTTWTAADTLSTALSDATSPQVAVETSGKTTVVWSRFDGVATRIQARTRPPELTWATSPVLNLSEAGQDAAIPQIAVDASGNATAVWSRSDGAHARVQASQRPVGAAWSAVPATLSVAGQIARDPQVVTDAAGNATVVWSRFDGTDYRVQSSRHPAGGGWSTPQTLSVVGQPATEPQPAVDAAGDVSVVWRRSDSVSTRVQGIGLDVAGPSVASVSIPATATAGQQVAMSVLASDTWSAVSDIAWAFGDGTSAAGAAVSHTYAAAGTFDVSLTLTDAVGNATTRTATITVAAAPAPPAPPTAPPPVGAAPAITGFRLQPARIRAVGSESSAKRKTKATVVLTAAAKVTFTVKRKGTRKPVAKLVKTLGAGTNTFRLTAKIGKKKLKPGRYVVKASTGQSTKKARLRVIR